MRTTAIALLLTALVGCGKKSESGPPPRRSMKFPVETAPVVSRKVEYSVSAVGTVEAFEKQQITARIAGAVEKVSFVEGDTVKAGQLLVAIEPARYGVAVQSAKATLARAEAAAADAEAGLKRRETAVQQNPGLLAGEEVETWRTRARTAAAEVASAKAMLAQAGLNLRDAYVRAPVAGVIESRNVQTGQYAQPGTVLATLVQREPLLLRFQVTELDSARISAGMKVRFRAGALPDADAGYSGVIKHVAAQADDTSRMVAVAAEIDDPRKQALRPGAFAEVRVPVGAPIDSPVVPQTAVRPSERGFLAFVVIDGVATERVLELGMRTEDGMVEVRSGLKAGEQLVIRGAEALKDGAQVRIDAPSGKPAPAPPGAGLTPTPSKASNP